MTALIRDEAIRRSVLALLPYLRSRDAGHRGTADRKRLQAVPKGDLLRLCGFC
jgi:hypothetical protein